ncbi:MAG TPA: response regulator [Gammaproteobacteria bacterium]
MISKHGKNPSGGTTQSSPLIVIADDDPSIRLILHHILEKEGYRVLEATNGLEALKLNQLHNPDLVILDAVMPEQDGFTTCKILKAKQPSLPVVMITALDDDSSVERAFQVGADDYITKPINWSVLKHRMAQTLLNPRNIHGSGDIAELNRLIDTAQLQIQFQPQIELLTEKNTCLRVCYHHGESNLYHRLTSRVLTEKMIGKLIDISCERYKSVLSQGIETERVCMPLLYCATKPEHFISSLQSATSRYGLNLANFDIAITEHLLSQTAYLQQIDSLADTPVHIVMDDFSFSLGSFDYLQAQRTQAVSINIPLLAQHIARNNYPNELFRDLLLPLKNKLKLIATGISQPDDIHLATELGFSHAEGPAIGKMITV